MKNLLTNLYLKAKTLSGDVSLSANEISQFIGGTVIGDGGVRVKDMVAPEFAREGDITFGADDETLQAAEKSKASCIVTTIKKDKYSKPTILVDDIKRALTMMYNAMLELKPPAQGSIHPTAVIAETAKLGKNPFIGPYAVIEDNVKIGDNAVIGANSFIGYETTIGNSVHIHPNVSIYYQIVIGNNVIIHAGTTVGSDGFGYVRKDDKTYKVPQLGNVIIEDNVEIGANTTVDRGTFTNTIVGKGSKIDNLVQIAHNDKLGQNVFMASQSGIAGSTTVGDNTMMGGGAGVGDHVTIGKNVKVGPYSAVHGKIKDDTTIIGYPAMDAKDFKKYVMATRLLITHLKKLKKLLRDTPDESPKGE